MADCYFVACHIVWAVPNQVSSGDAGRISVTDLNKFDRIVVEYDLDAFLREVDCMTAYPKFVRAFTFFYAASNNHILVRQRRLDRK